MTTNKTVRKSIIDKCIDFLVSNSRVIVSTVAMVGILLGIFFLQALWIDYHNQAAQKAFAPLIREYNQVIQYKSESWDLLRVKFEKEIEKHRFSTLLPYYKNFLVAILLKNGKNDPAEQLLDQIIADTKNSFIHSLYIIERALIDLDSSDLEKQNKGQMQLRAIVNDVTNQYRDMACFYLGRYYWAHDQVEDARAVWQILIDSQAHEKLALSPWVQQVEEYTKLIIA